MESYTYVDKVGNQICHRYVRDGEHHMEVVKRFPVRLYLKSDRGEFKSLYGDSLFEREFDRIADAADMVKEYDGVAGMPIFGQTDWVQQFIAHRYPGKPGELEFDIKAFKIATIDLEVAHDDGFPEPAQADQEIISMSYKEFGAGGRSVAFGCHPKPITPEIQEVEYIQCEDEFDMLEKFVEFFREEKPHFFTGWNVYSFDVPYLINRVEKVLGEGCADRLSPFYGTPGIKRFISNTYNKEGVDSYKILGVTVLDYIELYKKFHPEKRESYRLDYVGEIEEVGRKVEYGEYGGSLMRLYRGEWHVSSKLNPDELSTKDRWCRLRGILAGECRRRGVQVPEAVSHAVEAPAPIQMLESMPVQGLSDDELHDLTIKVDGHVKSLSYGHFLYYNTVDNDLVELLDGKLQYIQLAVAVSMLTKSRLSDAMTTVKIWDNLIYHMAYNDGFIIPPKSANFDAEKAGGFVKETVPGKYRWPVTFDLTSLYPSIARLLNMSPETQISEPIGGQELVDLFMSGEMRIEDFVGDGYCAAFNGVQFRTDVHGIVARAMSFVFHERARYKGLMKTAKKAAEAAKAEGVDEDKVQVLSLEVTKWDAFQKAVKVVNNGGYGALGNASFRYFRPAISDAITVTGQYVIRHIADRLNWFMNDRLKTTGVDYVIGSDTDSVMLTLAGFVDKIDPKGVVPTSKMVDIVNAFCEKEIEVFLAEEYDKLSDRVNAYERTLDMKREAICDVGIFRAKKNYAMRVWDMEHVRYAEPQLKIAGLESQRTDKPIPCREKMKELLPILFDGTEKELQDRIASFKGEFMKMPIDKIAFPKGVSDVVKWTGADGNVDPLMKSVPIHSRAAVVYNYLLSKKPEIHGVHPPIKNKSKIKFIYLKVPNPSGSYVVGFLTELPEEFGLHGHIDLESQFEKTFLNPMQSLATLVGWSAEKRAQLDDLFE